MSSPTPRYRYSFAAGTAPDLVVSLLREHVEPGLVLDIGCGYGVLAEALMDAGFTYVGLDLDEEAVSALRTRGLESHVVDITASDLQDVLVGLTAGRPTAALTAIDVIEHTCPHEPVLHAISATARRLGAAVAVSIPNVAHVDLGLKLIGGRWDVTTTGLLDDTHVTLFDHRRLADTMHRAGLTEVARLDFQQVSSEQSRPLDHPFLRPDSVVGEHLRRLRSAADEHAHTYQFVRLYRPAVDAPPDAHADAVTGDTAADTEHTARFSVLLSGMRADELAAALLALARQTVAPIEVLVHGDLPPTARVPVGLRIRKLAPSDAGALEAIRRAVTTAEGRYLCIVRPGEQLPLTWLEHFGRLSAVHSDLLLFHPCARGAAGEGVHHAWGVFAHVMSGGYPPGAFAVPVAALRHLPRLLGVDTELADDVQLAVLFADLAGILGLVDSAALGGAAADVAPVVATAPTGRVFDPRLVNAVGGRPLLLGTGWHHEVAVMYGAMQRTAAGSTSRWGRRSERTPSWADGLRRSWWRRLAGRGAAVVSEFRRRIHAR